MLETPALNKRKLQENGEMERTEEALRGKDKPTESVGSKGGKRPRPGTKPSEGGVQGNKERYIMLKKQLEELEQYNDKMSVRLCRWRNKLKRLKVERNILFERIEVMGKYHDTGSIIDPGSESESDVPLRQTFMSRKGRRESEARSDDDSETLLDKAKKTAEPARQGSFGGAKRASHSADTSDEEGSAPGSGEENSPGRRKRSERDPRAPKRPANAFVIYCRSQRATMKNIDNLSGDVVKQMGSMWRELPEAEKKKYYDAYNLERTEYKKNMTKYKRTIASKSTASTANSSTNKSSKDVTTLPASIVADTSTRSSPSEAASQEHANNDTRSLVSVSNSGKDNKSETVDKDNSENINNSGVKSEYDNTNTNTNTHSDTEDILVPPTDHDLDVTKINSDVDLDVFIDEDIVQVNGS